MDFVGRINADIKQVDIDTEPVPEPSGGALNLVFFNSEFLISILGNGK
jgi:hypothetical protein